MKNDHQKMFLKEFGMNLRQLRKEKGFTMEALADEVGLEYRQLGRIERGEVNTTIVTLLRISEVLKVDLNVLFIFTKTEKLN